MGEAPAEAVVAAARAGDEAAFSELVESYRRQLQVHCYRMLGSLEDSEDLVQETFLRAWRSRRSFRGQSSFRAWLYAIATNACLDALQRRRPRAVSSDGAQPLAEVPWLQGGFGDDSWGHLRCIPTRVNRQPAVACYLKRAGETEYRPLALDVLRIEDGAVAEIVAFDLEPLLARLGLPATL